jgi:hypothetical protein
MGLKARMGEGDGRVCVFCGNRANSKEHAVPLWLHEYLAGKGGTYLHEEWDDQGSEVRSWSAPLPDLKVRRVCKECNNVLSGDTALQSQCWRKRDRRRSDRAEVAWSRRAYGSRPLRR